MNKVLCPKCGSGVVEDFVWPEGTPLIKNGREIEIPAYKCNSCHRNFGTASGTSEYTDLMTLVELKVNSFFKGTFSIEVSGGKKGYFCKVDNNDDVVKYELTEAEFRGISNHLFNKAFVNDWKSSYYNAKVIDGTTWELAVKLLKKHRLFVHGCNGYPVYWCTMLKCFESYLSLAGINLRDYFECVEEEI